MKQWKFLMVGAITLVMSGQLLADIITMESLDGSGHRNSITLSETKARIQGENDPDAYLIADFKTNKFYVISHSQQAVIDLTPDADSASQTPDTLTLSLKKQGSGPRIAGYATTHYKVYAGNTFCYDEYLSKDILSNSLVRRFAEFLTKSGLSGQNTPMNEMMDQMSACDRIQSKLEAQYMKYGVPMKSVDSSGHTSHEISSIKSRTSVPNDFFEFPQGYRLTNQEEMMQKAMQGMPEGAMPGMPPGMDMEQIRQMQEEMMKRMKERMQEGTH
jgi:hypothetical protein